MDGWFQHLGANDRVAPASDIPKIPDPNFGIFEILLVAAMTNGH